MRPPSPVLTATACQKGAEEKEKESPSCQNRHRQPFCACRFTLPRAGTSIFPVPALSFFKLSDSAYFVAYIGSLSVSLTLLFGLESEALYFIDHVP